jgi:membrane fusion protein (multidrug efflux system)
MAMTSRWWRIGCLLLGCAVAFNNVFADEEDTLAVATVASVTTAPATAATISRYLTAYGTVEFSADHLHALSVPYQARVVSVLALAGQALHQGDPIIVLKPTATAELERQHAGSDAQFAQSELHRVRTLFAQHLATNSEVAAAEQAARNAEATQTAARGRFGNLAERTLHADSDGIVVSLTAHHDDILAADTQFAQIGDNNGLQLRLGIEPSAGAQVTTGQNVSFTLLQNDARPMQAKVERVSHQLDAQTRLIDVYATPDKPEQLSPGTAVTAKIEIATRPNVLSVPRSAVLYRDGKAFVFAIAAGKAAQRWVDVGDDDGTRIEIRSGLEANTPVVTLGNYELRDGMAVRVQ